jgi:ribosomal protein L12E/L44/L45/RPP1/RPP2
VKAFARQGDTNQTLQFDMDAGGRHLFVGSKEGCVRIYDVASGAEIQRVTGFDDCVNGVSVSGSLLAVATGQRHYGRARGASDASGACEEKEKLEEEEKEEEEEEEEEEEDLERGGTLSVLSFKPRIN